jgi:ketohexokinase
MARILGVGIATLDVVNVVDGYPREDDEVRAVSREIRRGGNATNTLVVLSQLGHRCAWAGTLAGDDGARHVREDLAGYGIDISTSRLVDDGATPTSYIVVNDRTGSRTIVHYRDLPEYGFEDFERIDLQAFDWLHFEGRNVDDTRLMLAHAHAQAPSIPRSVEIEKPRPGIEALFNDSDVLLFSRVFARATGHDDPRRFLEDMRGRTSAPILVCTWGDGGAYGIDAEGHPCHSPAFPPPRLVDTIGAGDTFNAGVIDALLRGETPAGALTAACRLAGRKCGQEGFAGLG